MARKHKVAKHILLSRSGGGKQAAVAATRETATVSPAAQSKCLEYLRTFGLPGWRFQKARQTWLMVHALRTDCVPASDFDLLVRYASTIQGGQRQRSIQDMEAAVQAARATAPDVPSTTASDTAPASGGILHLVASEKERRAQALLDVLKSTSLAAPVAAASAAASSSTSTSASSTTARATAEAAGRRRSRPSDSSDDDSDSDSTSSSDSDSSSSASEPAPRRAPAPKSTATRPAKPIKPSANGARGGTR